jgi:hypothetical protein
MAKQRFVTAPPIEIGGIGCHERQDGPSKRGAACVSGLGGG